MAKLNQGLTLNQMQLLAFAIYSTQQNAKTEFRKVAFEKKFGINRYRTEDAQKDVPTELSSLKFSIEDLENDKLIFEYFSAIRYERGYLLLKWNEDMIPHILELKEKYILTDLTIKSKFKSGFSWTLYDYLKAHYGYWHKPFSKEALMRLFCVENTKSYQMNSSLLKRESPRCFH